MKWRVFLICLGLVLSSIKVFSQARILEIRNSSDTYVLPEQNHNGGNSRSFFATLEIQDLLQSDEISMEFLNGEKISYKKFYSESRNQMDFSIAYNNGFEDLSITVFRDIIIGQAQVFEKTFSFEKIAEGVLFFQETDSQEDEEDYSDAEESSSPAETLSELSAGNIDTAIIRVLALYSTRNELPSNYIGARVRQAISNANISFVNSQIRARLELVYWGAVEYSADTARVTVLRHFQENNDGFMDEVHLLRQTYSADVCLFFDDKIQVCGRAAEIKANAGEAFSIVKSSYGCFDKYSMVHEIGHLIGCRHNRSADGLLIPYMYGHGYVYQNGVNGWRTMMSYDNDCNVSNPCDRKLYWSNPNVTYNGVPMGNTTYCNNARVWNNRASSVASFYTEPNRVYLMNIDVMNAQYGLCRAAEQITTLGTVDLLASSELILEAPEVILRSGFHAQEGCTMRITSSNSLSTTAFSQTSPMLIINRDDIPADLEKGNISSNLSQKIIKNGRLLIITPLGVYDSVGGKVSETE